MAFLTVSFYIIESASKVITNSPWALCWRAKLRAPPLPVFFRRRTNVMLLFGCFVIYFRTILAVESTDASSMTIICKLRYVLEQTESRQRTITFSSLWAGIKILTRLLLSRLWDVIRLW